MKRLFVGVDTSCYTTSMACVDENGLVADLRMMLCVESGERGIRQSESVFQHICNLEKLSKELFKNTAEGRISAVCASVKPRPRQDSYMPVFRAGTMAAGFIAGTAGAEYFETTHQQGHLRAALAGNEYLAGEPFLAVHLSGGTTEVLLVQHRSDEAVGEVELLGGSLDLSAGQFVDRVGVKLGLPFPAGPSLEKLAQTAAKKYGDLPSYVKAMDCSFSGVETRTQQLLEAGIDSKTLAFAVFDCIARTLDKLIANAAQSAGLRNVLLFGGVASSRLLRELLVERMKSKSIKPVFARPNLSGDNAVGAAMIGYEKFKSKTGRIL